MIEASHTGDMGEASLRCSGLVFVLEVSSVFSNSAFAGVGLSPLILLAAVRKQVGDF